MSNLSYNPGFKNVPAFDADYLQPGTPIEIHGLGKQDGFYLVENVSDRSLCAVTIIVSDIQPTNGPIEHESFTRVFGIDEFNKPGTKITVLKTIPKETQVNE